MGYLAVSINPNWGAVSPKDVASFEARLRSDPEDVEARASLLAYYYRNHMTAERLDSVLWLIEHHPESTMHSLDVAWLSTNKNAPMAIDPADFECARGLWEVAVAQYPDNAEVMHHAARF
jgi:hypothetical protein